VRAAWIALAVLLAGWCDVAPARAEEPDAETRRRAEYAFYVGRLWDLDGILGRPDAPQAAADRLPLLVRDLWWRGPVVPGEGVAAYPPGDPDPAHALAQARLAWLGAGGRGPWPVDERVQDPYPLLTALVQDRIRRERVGSAGLPDDGPIEAWWIANEATVDGRVREVFPLTYGMMVRSYRGDEDPREARELDREARDLRNRNKVLWLGLLGALLATAFIASVVVARPRR